MKVKDLFLFLCNSVALRIVIVLNHNGIDRSNIKNVLREDA